VATRLAGDRGTAANRGRIERITLTINFRDAAMTPYQVDASSKLLRRRQLLESFVVVLKYGPRYEMSLSRAPGSDEAATPHPLYIGNERHGRSGVAS
jgi:hypothetical protein